MNALFDHLWQSTLVAVALGLLTLAFRRNAASVRYGLWFAASVKFLLPFSLLMALADTLFPRLTTVHAAPSMFYRIASVARPFSGAHEAVVSPAPPDLPVTAILLTAWLCGFVGLSALWLVRHARLAALVRQARDVPAARPFPLKVSAGLLEPGLVGIRHPVLLLPEGMLERLSPIELEAIVAHEFCHFRRRDNLTAAIHMLIANVFWFHPLVWWLGARLIEERERACDESVLADGNDPGVYADSILKVCRFCVHSPLACAAGVSGANLKQRLETIMENRTTLRLNVMKKSLLVAAAATALAVPAAMAWAASGDTPQLVKQRLAEQRRPRTELSTFNPAQFDRFAGYYRITSTDVFVVSRNGRHYYAGVIGEKPSEIYPDSANEFFLKVLSLPAQYSFTIASDGRVTEMVLHQSGEEQHAPRIADSEGKAAEAALAQRIAENMPAPGTEDALRHQIDGLMSGNPDYGRMVPNLAAGTRQMLGDLHALVGKWGPVKSVTFKGVGKDGMDVYEVICQNKRSRWQIAPLTTDGKISSILFDEES